MLARPDLLILGGGAAGAALAVLAARRGIAVALVERGRPSLSGPHETLLAAGRARLERIGLADVVAAATKPDPLRHGALWGSDAVAWRDDADRGLLLARGRFDAALRRLRLVAHPHKTQVVPTAQGVPWVGFVVYPQRIGMRREALRRLRRRLRGGGGSGGDGERWRAVVVSLRGHARYGISTGRLAAWLGGVGAGAVMEA